MAARGAVAKENIIQAILETFPGAFKYDKEIRIPMMENGEEVQIKVTLTAAKTNVERGGDVAVPGAAKTVSEGFPPVSAPKVPMEPTKEEKENVKNLLNMLGF